MRIRAGFGSLAVVLALVLAQPVRASSEFSGLIGVGKRYWLESGSPAFPRIAQGRDQCGYACTKLDGEVCYVWFAPGVYDDPRRAEIASHEVGHCLGLGHVEQRWYSGVMRAMLDDIDEPADDVRLCRRMANC